MGYISEKNGAAKALVPAAAGNALAVPLRKLAEIERDIDQLRRTRDPALRKALLPRWREVDRQASGGQIAAHVALLVGAWPNLPEAKAQALSMTLVTDITAEQPTVFELAAACRLVRKQCEFLSVAVVMRALEYAKTKMTPRRRILLEAAPDTPFTEQSYWAWLDMVTWRDASRPPAEERALPPLNWKEAGDE
jgi:hypothetical protein